MYKGFKEVNLIFFSGGNLPKVSKATAEDSSDFEFTPSIWTTLNYAYKHGAADTSSQGSNGCTVYIPGNQGGDIWYDIINGVWLNNKDAQKAGF